MVGLRYVNTGLRVSTLIATLMVYEEEEESWVRTRQRKGITFDILVELLEQSLAISKVNIVAKMSQNKSFYMIANS